MPGIGFVIFVLPVLVGFAAGLGMLLFPKLRRFAAYAILVPPLGAIGAWKGCDIAVNASQSYALASRMQQATLILLFGFTLGGAIGSACGALVAKLMNMSFNRWF